MNIEIIESEKEYEAAIARLSRLMDIDAGLNSEEEAELGLLALAMQGYERTIVDSTLQSPLDNPPR